MMGDTEGFLGKETQLFAAATNSPFQHKMGGRCNISRMYGCMYLPASSARLRLSRVKKNSRFFKNPEVTF